MTDLAGIHYNAKGDAVSFSGKDAVEVFRAATLASAIGLLAKGIKPTRGLTMKKALAMAERYTGRTYKRTEWEQARADIRVWVQTMKSALPTTQDGEAV